MKNTLLMIVGIALLASLPQHAFADWVVVPIGSADVTGVTPEDTTLGDYFVFAIDVPDGVTGDNFRGAVLELRIDVSVRSIDGYTGEGALLEVYPLEEAFESELNVAALGSSSGMRRNVMVGGDRNVRIDVTEVVRGWLDSPSSNHGLVIGSVTNLREGLFSLESDAYGTSVPARLTFYFD